MILIDMAGLEHFPKQGSPLGVADEKATSRKGENPGLKVGEDIARAFRMQTGGRCRVPRRGHRSDPGDGSEVMDRSFVRVGQATECRNKCPQSLSLRRR